MSSRWHSFHYLVVCLAAVASLGMMRLTAEEPGAGYVPDLEIEKLIAAATDTDRAVAFPAQKKLSELGAAAERALNYKLFAEKTSVTRRTYAELLARCCPGRVGYRVTLELTPDGAGRLILESDRTMLAECAQKFDRLNNKVPIEFPPDELRRNPYSKVDLAKHIVGTIKYNQGGSVDNKGRILASGEIGFTNFDDFAAFATSFDKLGYHMLNGISIFDNNNLRTLRFKKNPENERNRALTYLLMFHDVKWEFVLDFKGQIKNQNSARAEGGKYVWQFNCAQMLSGEAEIEASFDPFTAKAGNENPGAQIPPSPAVAPGTLAAIPANKLMRVAIGQRYDKATQPNPNGPDTIAVLDGTPSQPRGPDLRYQWVQTSGIDLNLAPESMTRPMFKMLFFEAGKYTFELTVSQNGQKSAPAEVVVLVGDRVAPDNLANQERPPVELKLKKDVATVPAQPSKSPPPNDNEGKFIVTPPTIAIKQDPPVAPRRDPAPIVASKGIELDEIRREEKEYNLRAKAIQVSNHANNVRESAEKTLNHVVQDVQGVANKITPAPAPSPDPIVIKKEIPPIKSDKGNENVITTGRIELDEIRREEEEFAKTHPLPKVPPRAAVRPTIPPEPVKPVEEKIASKPIENPIVKPVVIEKAVPPVPVNPAVAVAPVKKDPPIEKPIVKPIVVEKKVESPATAGVDTNLEPIKPVVQKPEAKIASAELKKDPVKPATDIKKTDDPVLEKAKEAERKAQEELAALQAKIKGDANPKEVVKVNVPPPVEPTKPTPKVETAKITPPITPVKPEPVKPVAPVVVKETPAPPPAVPAGNTGDALQRGIQLTKAGQYSAAVVVLKPAAEANLKDEKTQMALAVALFEAAESANGYDRAGTQAALDKFTEVVTINSENAFAFMYAGHCNARLNNEQDKGNFYRRSLQLNREKVLWEVRWAAGNGYLKQNEFAGAVDMLTAAEDAANAAGIKDYRLLRDLAIAFHGVKKDDEAIKRVNALYELGYLPDQKLVAELKKVSPDAVKVPDSAYSVDAKPTAVTLVPPAPTKPEVSATTPTPGAVNSTLPVPPVANNSTLGANVATAQAPKPAQTLPDLDKVKPDHEPPPRPNPKKVVEQPVKEAPRVARPMPPIPATFELALQAATKAVAKAKEVYESNSPESLKLQDYTDDAEYLLRGAWAMKPDDPEVRKQFEILAEFVGVIALVKSPLLISKPNGLIVLSAEPSIVFPEGKTMYYAWQQVDGTPLSLRADMLDKRTVGLRIKPPGTYKFELVVSDGVRGGNPVTVTVEVR